MITLKALRRVPNYQYITSSLSYNSTSGPGQIIGVTMLDVRILNITKRIILNVIDPKYFDFDIIMGTNYIPSFYLNLDYNLKITQTIPQSINVTVSPVPFWNNYMTEESFKNKVEHLNHCDRSAIFDFISRNVKVFAKDRFDVGNVTNYSCPVKLSSDSYIAKKPYRCSFRDQEVINRQCSELLEKGIIRESSSPYAAPVTLQYKKHGLRAHKVKDRMCTDYRELNKYIIPQNQPFPLIDDIVVRTRDCSYFSAFDINAAFLSLPIDEKDRHKTAFITQTGQYEYCSLPFGLKISPAAFQSVLAGILRRYKLDGFAVNYLDDILVYSKSFEEHLVHIQLLVDAILAEGFRLNFEKCNFATSRIQYLGHIITPGFVQPLSSNIVAITKFPEPTSRRSVRRFLGKINFYRKFIPNSSSLLEPFHNLLRKHSKFIWSRECQSSFETVKKYLTTPPILAIFDPSKPTVVYSDASGIGVAALLKQVNSDGLECPVAYFSKKLSEAQKKKTAIYIEALAIREAIFYWRYWLIGCQFTVVTDHKPLEHMNLKARPDEELGDIALELSQFDFDVIYRPGKDNHEADCLSRSPVNAPSVDAAPSEPLIPSCYFLSTNDIIQYQKDLHRSNEDIIQHGVIFRKYRGGSYIALDKQTGKDLIDRIHSHYGHIGPKHMFSILRKHFTFPDMTCLVLACCNSCSVCVMNKSRRTRLRACLGHLGPASRPYEIMSLDTIGGVFNRSSSLRYIHLLVDHFSRYAWAICSKGQAAKDVISLIDSVQRTNPIGTLLTDQYGGLASSDFNAYCLKSGIRHIFTAIDSPASNGLNERVNQTLINKIRCVRNDSSYPSRFSVSSIVKLCVEQYNASPHSVTSFVPTYLLTGIPSSPIPPSLVRPHNYETDKALALERSIKYHQYNKKLYQRNKLDVNFNVDDLVYVTDGNKMNRNKLDPIRIGPYQITSRLSNNVFQVNVGHGPQPYRLYHASKIIKLPS